MAAPASGAQPNVLLVCIDDLRPELGCYGVGYVHSPNIDALAARSRVFDRHFVQAPTCGASRCALLTGRYGPAGNGALFQRSERMDEATASLPTFFRRHGYTTVSIGKVSHHPGGWGGEDWDDHAKLEMPDSWDRQLMPVGPWEHPRGAMHGLADGEIRVVRGEMAVLQSHDGPDSAYPDGLITAAGEDELAALAAAGKPFFLAVGIIRPHLPFGAPATYMEPYTGVGLPPVPHPEKPSGRTTWHGSGEFMGYQHWGKDPRVDTGFATEVRRHYAACVSYADAMVGRLLGKLRELGLEENTVVALWGDHGWHLGEHAVWGKHTLFEESLRSPLIIRSPGTAPGRTGEIVETIDLFPTLAELAGLQVPEFCTGRSLVPALAGGSLGDGSAVSYGPKAKTLRTGRYRLVLHSDGFTELYDHEPDPGETENVAPMRPGVVAEMSEVLEAKLGG